MAGYTKLSSSLVTSTVWRESATTRVVWITMLSLANAHGEVEGSVPGLADMARVTVDECREALQIFLSPDPESRSRENDGRRIAPIDGGWVLLNYAKFRDIFSADYRRELARNRQRRRRQAQKEVGEHPPASNDTPAILPGQALPHLCDCAPVRNIAPSTGKQYLAHAPDCASRNAPAVV